MANRNNWQREFFRLAAVWLGCRCKELDPTSVDRVWNLLGELDYQTEMYLLIAENKRMLGWVGHPGTLLSSGLMDLK